MKMLLVFVVGLMVGGLFGVGIMCLMIAGSDEQYNLCRLIFCRCEGVAVLLRGGDSRAAATLK